MNNGRFVFYLMLLSVVLNVTEARAMFGFGKELNDGSRTSKEYYNELYRNHQAQLYKKNVDENPHIKRFFTFQRNQKKKKLRAHSGNEKTWRGLQIIDTLTYHNKILQHAYLRPYQLKRVLEEYRLVILLEAWRSNKQAKKKNEWKGIKLITFDK